MRGDGGCREIRRRYAPMGCISRRSSQVSDPDGGGCYRDRGDEKEARRRRRD
jgi:hypothetical protein